MKTYDIQSRARDPELTAVVTTTLPIADIGPWLARAYPTVARAIGAQGVGPTGPPFARYHQVEAGRLVVEAGFPVATAIKARGDVQPSRLPGGRAAVTVHEGPCRETGPAFQALASWVRDHGGQLAGYAWEVYLSDPASEPDPATWRTEIVQPYRPA
jgi:effector-binding domain-containing protein